MGGGYSQVTKNSTEKIAPNMIYNSAGQLVPVELLLPEDHCTVDGITITASGNLLSAAPLNANYNYCYPSAFYSGFGGYWTGLSTTGAITYNFSQPIYNVTITYVGVNDYDTGTIAINNTGMQLSNLCGLSAVGSLLSCTFPSGTFGDVSLTVSSPNPFTSITLTNTGGLSGWQTGNLCNFIFGSEIQNCDKIYLDFDICYHETQAQTTTYTAFNHSANNVNGGCEPCLINGVPCSASNVTIEPIGPIPYGCIINPNGTVTFPAGTPPFDMHTEGQLYYNLRSIQNPTVVSGPYRLNFGISPKALPHTPNIWIENASSANPSYYVNGSVNVLTDSYVRTSITGDCDNNIIAAEIGFPIDENKVTLHELTNPQNPYYQLDTQTGSIIYRPPYSNTNQPPMPTLPQRGYQLTYEMCVNHNGVATFCEWAYIDINYVFANRIANPNHIVKVYPNPSIDGVYALTFEEKFATAIIEVYNLMGILVHQEEVKPSNEVKLYLNALPKGTYVLKTTVNNTTYTSKLIKQ